MADGVRTQQIADSPYTLLHIWFVTLALKLLLFVGYHSTDFDVHRNWLAITHNLPLSQWYIEDTSQWTLDYPPFFAYFEWFLSQLVPQIVKDDGCLDLVEKGQYGLPTVYFQRLTVIVSEIVLFWSLHWYMQTSKKRDHITFSRSYVVAASLVLSPGLLIIDHIHFQYNGMMYGFLILMINNARLKNYLWCGFWFALLLCFKHIYLYLAPAVFIFLLRSYCLNLKFSKKANIFVNLIRLIRWKNSIKLGLVVLSVFGVAFLPFYNQLPQLLGRLFPFSRGLTHAYWAPNVWAIYSFLDRLLIQVYKNLPLSHYPLQSLFEFNPLLLEDESLISSSTRGLVGDIEFLILPTITPQLTFYLTLFYQVLALLPLFYQPTFRRFLGALTLCGYSSFLFGWHVHEKAILLVIFPITFLVSRDKVLLGPFNLLVGCGYVSLFPLIFTCNEWPVKVIYTILWYIIFYFNFRKVVSIPKVNEGNILDRVINGYILGLIPLVIITTLIDIFENKFEFLKKLEFLKLMLYSIYCGVGIISSFNGFFWYYFIYDSLWID
ncbi:glycosyl transferase [Scheffersomyces coipomensis]|uniref:glycosyl transferase n=1 Tax=Scheffersomyces coipomensis TaxID=1788519 RepID=UPI00315D00A1